MASEAHCRHQASGTVHFLMSVTLLIILSRATLTSTLASCNADPSLSLTDSTQRAETVLAGTLVRLEGESIFIFKVLQVLKGDAKLHKKKIRIRVSDVTEAPPPSRDASLMASLTPPDTRAYTVAMTTPSPLSSRCLSEAVLNKKYIVFVQRLGTSRRTFELLSDGVPQSKKAVKAVKLAIEEDITTRATTPLRVSSTLLTQTMEEGGFTTSDNQQSTNPEDTQDEVGSTNTDYLPKTSDAHFEPCPEKYDAYCFNKGMCHWVSGISQPSCECVNGYRGERCEYRVLEKREDQLFGDYWEVFIIGTIFGIVILLTLIGAIVYVVRKRKASQTRRQTREEQADDFIQNNFQPSEDVEQQQQQPDDNQNKTADRYMRLPTNETYPIVETAIDSETLPTTNFGNSAHPSRGNSFKLQDPPFRKGSIQSTISASKESTV